MLKTLTFQHLSFERADKKIFHDIHAHLSAGDLLEVLGENGSGKSTLLRAIAGLIRTRGTIKINDVAMQSDQFEYQQHLHYLSHQNALQQHLTVNEYFKLYGALANLNITEQSIAFAMQSLALKICLDEKIVYLSAGQKRKLSMAKLIIHPKPIWILDEPFNAVDSKGQFSILSLFHQHLLNQGIIIIATHQPLQLHPNKQQIMLESTYA